MFLLSYGDWCVAISFFIPHREKIKKARKSFVGASAINFICRSTWHGTDKAA
jgi:hypothetical protein